MNKEIIFILCHLQLITLRLHTSGYVMLRTTLIERERRRGDPTEDEEENRKVIPVHGKQSDWK